MNHDCKIRDQIISIFPEHREAWREMMLPDPSRSEAATHVGPLFVGEGPATIAFLPSGDSGARLAKLLGVDSVWDVGAAVNMCNWLSPDEMHEAHPRHRVIVLLGRHVQKWYGLPHAGDIWMVRGRDQKVLLGVPHPSGRCRFWNTRQNRVRGEAALRWAVLEARRAE